MLAVAGCSEAPEEPHPEANPLLFEIASADGEVEGWMLGTIHALPDDVHWQTSTIQRVVDEADYLIVEIAALDDSAAIGRTFNELATSPGQTDLTQRVEAELRPALRDLMARANRSDDDFSTTETWAAALILARVAATGDPANGVDRVITRKFAGREVREFEGALAQLGIFDQLPEADQRDLLEGVIAEVEQTLERPGRLRNAWLTGDVAILEEATRTGIMADPELRDALIVQRNRRWAEQLEDDLRESARPLVAVGSGHLVGEDSLVTMLQQRGYRVTRLGQ
ncbi:TraB/GumN family protein [Erythrobacter sp. KMU-140]|uniref:TraB/GumN family protein n=2 Tax=Erythrobacter rubeus TaxID=2760803 RepID=A0ABR8KPP4_9SPHN|nr:TraB/GumN family protein [Erythrobacter rubeus]